MKTSSENMWQVCGPKIALTNKNGQKKQPHPSPSKMSRPKKRASTLMFSRNAVICQRDGTNCLLFRVILWWIRKWGQDSCQEDAIWNSGWQHATQHPGRSSCPGNSYKVSTPKHHIFKFYIISSYHHRCCCCCCPHRHCCRHHHHCRCHDNRLVWWAASEWRTRGRWCRTSRLSSMWALHHHHDFGLEVFRCAGISRRATNSLINDFSKHSSPLSLIWCDLNGQPIRHFIGPQKVTCLAIYSISWMRFSMMIIILMALVIMRIN